VVDIDGPPIPPRRQYTFARVVELPDNGGKRVLFTAPGGICEVNWINSLGEPKSLRYEIDNESDSPGNTKMIYDTEGASRAPTVDLSDVPHNPVLCGHGTVLVDGSATVTNESSKDVSTENWSGNIWLDDNDHLHADTIDDSTQWNAANERIVMIYEDGAGYYQSNEVICIRQYFPDDVREVDIGARLPAPMQQKLGGIEYPLADNEFPYVAAGKMNSRDDAGYIYQHTDLGDLNGRVYTTRESSNPLKMEVFWMRDGLYDAVWPYRMRRYTTAWPDETAQRYIRRAESTEPHVVIPYELNPYLMPEEKYDGQFDHGYITGQDFYSDGPGYSLLLLESGPVQSRDWLEFVVVKSVMHTETDEFRHDGDDFVDTGGTLYTNRAGVEWPIGTALSDAYHHGSKSGSLYYTAGRDDNDDSFHPGFYGEADAQGMYDGEIFAVNANGGTLEVWWSNETHTNTAEHGVSGASIQWPSYVMVYTNVWPEDYGGPEAMDTNVAVLARQDGVGETYVGLSADQWALYYQNDMDELGYNPNDEHAIVMQVESGEGLCVFPLRCDMYKAGEEDCSKPYLLIENQSGTDEGGNPVNELDVYQVVATNNNDTFVIPGNKIGAAVRIPYPLQRAPQIICSGSYLPHPDQSAIWRDRKKWFWARAGGNDASLAEKEIRFYYNVLDGFYFPQWYRSEANAPEAVKSSNGELASSDLVQVPWLDQWAGTIGTPAAITYGIEPKDNVPVMYMGQTLTKPLNGLPAVWDQRGVEIIYQQASYVNDPADPENISVALIDPLLERNVAWPESQKTMDSGRKDRLLQTVDGKSIFKDLPAHLRKRLVYDEVQGQGYLRFGGHLIEPSPGNHYLLLNAISVADSNVLVNTFDALGEYNGTTFGDVLDGLISTCTVKYAIQDEPTANLALSTGPATAGGYVTLAFNNSTNTDINAEGDPVSLGVLYVSNMLYTGQIFPVNTDNPFDENLVMRHTLDFGGEGEYQYEWQYTAATVEPDVTATNETLPQGWSEALALYKDDGLNETALVVGGKPDFVLNDNFFTLRYKPVSPEHPLEGQWSNWVTPPKIAMSWVKRVMDGINPFEQRVQAFDSYAPNTLMTMLEQVGTPYAGAVPLNLDHVDDYGLIEIYQTVFERALDLSYNTEGNNHDLGIDNTLLLAAGRLADLYMILGNEAYADAQDPTIGFGTEHGEYGTEASSIYCFQNIVPSLLSEELCLLRGRDGSAAPGVDISPHYNRLPWNMSWDIGGGEVAYTLNYEITDIANATSMMPPSSIPRDMAMPGGTICPPWAITTGCCTPGSSIGSRARKPSN
jgi:hypothetical protein